MTPHRPDAARPVARYLWLWGFALAMAWFEGAVVVYLRELYYPQGFGFPLVVIPPRVAIVEIAREAASLLMIAAVACLAGRHLLERVAAFLLVFGVWDLGYYAVLALVLGWPPSLSTWDVLFLIPVPWVAPVWAPVLIALTLVSTGSYLFLTADRPRVYRLVDWAIEVAAGLIVIASFTADWRAAGEGRLPQDFPAWLFWTGFLLALGWFIRAERRAGTLASGAFDSLEQEFPDQP